MTTKYKVWNARNELIIEFIKRNLAWNATLLHTVCFLDILKGMFICLFKVRKFFHCAMHWCNSSLSQKKQSLAWPQWGSFENRFLLRTQTRCQKLGIIFENKMFQEIKLPYALHYKLWLVCFLPHFSLWLIL